jgi:putative ABC transport system substrate-binding protein
MRPRLLAWLAVACVLAGWGHARAEIVTILQSGSLPVYSELQAALVTQIEQAGPRIAGKRIASVSTLMHDVSKNDAPSHLKLKYSDVVVAIGTPALEATRDFGPPVVYLLSPSPEAAAGQRPNVTGVRMVFPPAAWARITAESFAGRTRVGLLHSPGTAAWVREAETSCRAAGLTLVSRKVENNRDFPAALQGLAGQVDVLWMVPDLALLTPETAERLALFSLENRIPLVTFSERFLKAGATAALLPDLNLMAAQAAGLVVEILQNPATRPLPAALEPIPLIRWNETVAGKLGLRTGADPGKGLP